MGKKKQPIGVSLLGGFNFFVLGLGSLLLLGFFYRQNDSVAFQNLLSEMTRYFPEANIPAEAVKKAIFIQAVLSFLFTLTGLGLLQGREIARKATLYFAFFMVAVIFVAVLLSPGVIRQAFLQIIYPGVLIIYFTNSKIEKYFSQARKTNQKGKIA